MIELTKWSGAKFMLNVWHIEQIEESPDTLIVLINGKRLIVKESAEEVTARANQFFKEIQSRPR
ncbi:hypothetical protein BEP19_07295 [Ammoniphilus oxalaticus]|uniref:Flagellar protein FlbD n=1 Tax=Ammoniphilus oxalaticus TaxID=66863 RepID=A0A419SJL0_9BACL|nr:flagellar FlbD family protein [Ammoniphilus oxalaticus]RKD24203.1 hypothetical protein BEP19_07295 [Ammoniphilus oxalaticus]